jgi:heme/copper-type cytochrome/quinol oxidase subunit 3
MTPISTATLRQSGFITLPERQTPISNGRLGIILLIGTETILFASFISAYLVLRMGSTLWPPAGTPRLQLDLSVANTLILLASSVMAIGARQALRRQAMRLVRALLGATFSLGSLFLILQGVEFHRLHARGLTLRTGPYGAVFFSLAACHGFHVLGGLAFLGVLLARAAAMGRDRLTQWREWVGYSEIYWHFVTAVWLVLFTILYIV